VLSGVARLGPISAAALGAEIGLDRSIVSRRAERLIDAGLLKAYVDPDDRRAGLLALTPHGEEIIAMLRGRLVIALDTDLRSWSRQDRSRFASLFARFVQNGPL
jgi:DNA-binding MarR family transcriptional regulator